MTLETLLDRALINRFQRHEWFSCTKLVGSTLLVADNSSDTITRCFLPKLREFIADLDVKHVSNAAPAASAAKPKQPLWKKAYRGRAEVEETQGDLL